MDGAESGEAPLTGRVPASTSRGSVLVRNLIRYRHERVSRSGA